jgi:hypothetical protein
MIRWEGQDAIMPNIEFDVKETLGTIVQSKNGLRVPVNQRSYAWKKEHVKDLFTDLNGAITKGADEYFLGTIIVLIHKDTNSGIPSVEVHDGQQRLATTLILIGAIRDSFYKSKDVATATEIARVNLRTADRRTLNILPRFQLSLDDNQFFTDRILRNPDEPERLAAKPDPRKESHQRIEQAAKEAASFIRTITKSLPSQDKAQVLHRWIDFLETGARVIWVEVGDQATAYRIFETMNDRGLRLSEADLIKNYLCGVAEKRRDEIVQRWNLMIAILESLGREDGDIVDYIRCLWITTHGQTRSSELFDKIKKEVQTEASAINWVTTLEARANDYAAILTSSHSGWNGYHLAIRTAVAVLRFLEVTQVRPVLLAAYGQPFDKKTLGRLVKVAVNWSVRCLLSGVPSGTLEGFYSRSAKKISDGAITTIDELAEEMAPIIPRDDKFLEAAATASVASSALARYYLTRLQIEKDGDTDKEKQYVPGEHEKITLEHILPVRPGPEWAHISAEDAKANFNRLGNQALLTESVNSRIGNVGFETKKAALAESEYSLTQLAAQASKWDLEEITKRQRTLAEIAVKAWPLK